MARISVATEQARIFQTLQVLTLMGRGNTEKEACAIVQISPDTFRDWLARGDESIKALQQIIVETERIELANVLAAKNLMLSRIIEEASKEDASFFVLTKTYDLLKKLQDELETKHGVHKNTSEDHAGIILSGPSLQKQESMIPASYERTATINLKAKPDGSVDVNIPVQGEIIDYEDSEQDAEA